MGAEIKPKTGYQRWQDGIDAAVRNAKWDVYDCDIRLAVGEFNSHLGNVGGFRPLDWKLIKAMIWVESGAAHPEWRTRPMQIGVPGDPGLNSLLSGDEGGELILPPQWQRMLTVATVRSQPAHNIRAGTGYLLMRMANFEFKSVRDPDIAIHEVVVKKGDRLDNLAKTHHTTVEIFKQMNSTTELIRPGQTLKYQRGKVKRVIVSWRPFVTGMIAQRYNGGGDPAYAQKLDHALSLIQRSKETTCG